MCRQTEFFKPPATLVVLPKVVCLLSATGTRMADVVVLILQVVDEIHDIAKGIKESDRQASRLSERVAAVEPAVFAIKRGRRVVSSSEALRQLSATLEDIRNFLSEYAGTSKINRAMNRKSNAAKFARLGALLTEGMQALQLNVSVEEWAKEDASDRLEDLENFIDMLESMERQRNRNHAEVMGNQAEQMCVLKDVLKVRLEGGNVCGTMFHQLATAVLLCHLHRRTLDTW